MASVFLRSLVDAVHGIETAVEDILKGAKVASTDAPVVAAKLALLLTSVDKSIADASAAVANPATLTIEIPAEITDIKTDWAAIVALLATFGVKVP